METSSFSQLSLVKIQRYTTNCAHFTVGAHRVSAKKVGKKLLWSFARFLEKAWKNFWRGFAIVAITYR